MFEVHNSTDLLTAFDHKEEEFIIKGDYCKNIREYAKSQLIETELLGDRAWWCGYYLVFWISCGSSHGFI